MIRFGERDDKFAWALIASDNLDARLLEAIWSHKSDELVQQIRLSFKEFWCLASYRIFEFLCITAWHTVPCFGRTPVH